MTHLHQLTREKVVDFRLQELISDVFLSVPISRASTVQPQHEPGSLHSQNDDDDDVVIVDSPQQSPGKRKVGDDQSSPRPQKRQTFWVEISPRSKRKKVLSALVKAEESTPEVVMQVTATIPAIEEEPDQETADALTVMRNVCYSIFLKMPRNNSRPAFPLLQTSSKKDNKSLDDVSVFTRLSRIGLEIFPITVEDEVKGFSVARALLSAHFGGSSRGAFPNIKKEKVKKHGFDNLMYANLVSTQNLRKMVTLES